MVTHATQKVERLTKKYNSLLRGTGIALAMTLGIAWGSQAQAPLKSHMVDYEWQLGQQGAASVQASPDAHVVRMADATWLRLYFDNVTLGKGDRLILTSLLDGATQTLDSESIKTWGNSSAYFNGDAVKVTLVQSSQTQKATIGIAELEVGEPQGVGTLSQCGPVDDRLPSNDAAIGRIVPIGCTGWIIKNGKMVTAGHCTGSRMQVLEFNVPASNGNGSIVHPAPKDQYTVASVNKGNLDWAVFTTADNTQTGKSAMEAQGKSYNVVQATTVSTIRITGFGVDRNDNVRNQVQQTHTGPFSSMNTTKVYYATDTEGGNSGSPIIDEATGNAIGVHTHGGCRTTGTGANSGTNAQHQPFWDAMDLGGGGGGPVTYCASQGGGRYEFIARVAIGDLDNASPGSSPYTDFTSKTANLGAGSHSMSLTPGFSGSAYTEYWKVWIDFNKDGDFSDAGEQVFSGSGRTVVSGSVAIPASATGTTRMRVAMKYGSSPAASCGDIGDGEVEDYTVSFGGTASAAQRATSPSEAVLATPNYKALALSPNPTNGLVKAIVGNFEQNVALQLFNMQGQRIPMAYEWDGNQTYTINMAGLAKGIYIVTMKTEREVINQKLMVE